LTLLPSIDGRSTWARIMRDTYSAMISHAGGADYVPETKRLLARRIAAIESECVHLEDKFALAHARGGEPAVSDLELYGRLTGQQRRCLEALGWERTQRDITPPDLATYIATKYARADDAVEATERA
jgi:hypothetical protein